MILIFKKYDSYKIYKSLKNLNFYIKKVVQFNYFLLSFIGCTIKILRIVIEKIFYIQNYFCLLSLCNLFFHDIYNTTTLQIIYSSFLVILQAVFNLSIPFVYSFYNSNYSSLHKLLLDKFQQPSSYLLSDNIII